MGTDEMGLVADLIARTLKGRTDEREIDAVRSEVAELCAAFPPYPDLLS
jgi:glycine/serine hydroxymethyltransferase